MVTVVGGEVSQHSLLGGTNSNVCGPKVRLWRWNHGRSSPSILTRAFCGPTTGVRTVRMPSATGRGGSASLGADGRVLGPVSVSVGSAGAVSVLAFADFWGAPRRGTGNFARGSSFFLPRPAVRFESSFTLLTT